jgi:uncharacterized protein (TIGR03032 family)
MQTPASPPAPFTCTFSPNVPELLLQLRCSIAITTYQAGKVVFISPRDENYLVQLPRTFEKAMGLALHGNRMAVACKSEVVVLSNSPELASFYPKQPQTYDALFMPRAAYYTGMVDIHDIDWAADGTLYAVNTSFSCIARVDDQFSFTPVWKPPFISRMVSEDRCHLNGMAMDQGRPRYATAFSQTDTPHGWRDTVTKTGVVFDLGSSEVVAHGVPMPHSPRVFDGRLYVLLSATGEVVEVDPASGAWNTIIRLDGFVRGLARHGDYLFVGLSKLRKNSSTFAHLEIADKAKKAGIAIIHLPTGTLVGQIHYEASVDEIYDVQVLPNTVRPGILNNSRPEYKLGLDIPGATFWAPAEALQDSPL